MENEIISKKDLYLLGFMGFVREKDLEIARTQTNGQRIDTF